MYTIKINTERLSCMSGKIQASSRVTRAFVARLTKSVDFNRFITSVGFNYLVEHYERFYYKTRLLFLSPIPWREGSGMTLEVKGVGDLERKSRSLYENFF